MQPKDYYHKKAEHFGKSHGHTDNVTAIAEGILGTFSYDNASTHVMDFGSGTGLLTQKIAPHVRKITTVDVSPAMNAQLKAKLEHFPCEVEMLECDLTCKEVDAVFDSIVSSMTIHHVEDVGALFEKFYRLLKNGGSIALADLETEDGSFHSDDDTGVFHLGFELETFKALAKQAGFEEVEISIVTIAKKSTREYPVFLLTGRKG
jgi:ubiquinone/menaquinone biosynthesis C-methylase UbiE